MPLHVMSSGGSVLGPANVPGSHPLQLHRVRTAEERLVQWPGGCRSPSAHGVPTPSCQRPHTTPLDTWTMSTFGGQTCLTSGRYPRKALCRARPVCEPQEDECHRRCGHSHLHRWWAPSTDRGTRPCPDRTRFAGFLCRRTRHFGSWPRECSHRGSSGLQRSSISTDCLPLAHHCNLQIDSKRCWVRYKTS